MSCSAGYNFNLQPIQTRNYSRKGCICKSPNTQSSLLPTPLTIHSPSLNDILVNLHPHGLPSPLLHKLRFSFPLNLKLIQRKIRRTRIDRWRFKVPSHILHPDLIRISRFKFPSSLHHISTLSNKFNIITHNQFNYKARPPYHYHHLRAVTLTPPQHAIQH